MFFAFEEAITQLLFAYSEQKGEAKQHALISEKAGERGRGTFREKNENRANPCGTHGDDMGETFDPNRKRGRTLGPITGVPNGLMGVVQSVGGDVES